MPCVTPETKSFLCAGSKSILTLAFLPGNREKFSADIENGGLTLSKKLTGNSEAQDISRSLDIGINALFLAHEYLKYNLDSENYNYGNINSPSIVVFYHTYAFLSLPMTVVN